jgi:hypothetical protein
MDGSAGGQVGYAAAGGTIWIMYRMRATGKPLRGTKAMPWLASGYLTWTKSDRGAAGAADGSVE